MRGIADGGPIQPRAGGVLFFVRAAAGGLVGAEGAAEPAGFVEGEADEAIGDGRPGGRAAAQGAVVEGGEQPGGGGGDREVVGAMADFPGVGAAREVAGRSADDIAAVGFDIDALAEAVAGPAHPGALGAAEQKMEAAAAGELPGRVGERAVGGFEVAQRVIAAIAWIDIDDQQARGARCDGDMRGGARGPPAADLRGVRRRVFTAMRDARMFARGAAVAGAVARRVRARAGAVVA